MTTSAITCMSLHCNTAAVILLVALYPQLQGGLWGRFPKRAPRYAPGCNLYDSDRVVSVCKAYVWAGKHSDGRNRHASILDVSLNQTQI